LSLGIIYSSFIYFFRLFGNVNKEMTSHIMKAKLYNKIIVIRLLREFCVF